MKNTLLFVLAMFATTTLFSPSPAQQPRREAPERSKPAVNPSIVEYLMSFDKNKDGKLTREEVTDARVLRLFDRADTNKDGVVTRDELTALAAQMDAEIKQEGERGGPGGRGFDGPGVRGPGGPGRFGGPPRPGEILPGPLQERLGLTAEQRNQLRTLQQDVDSKLGKILTDEQKRQLREMREGFGPGGRGPGDGPPRR